MYWLYRHWYSVIINGKAVSILEELQEISQAISFRSVSWHSSCLLWYFLLEWRTGNEISNWRGFSGKLDFAKKMTGKETGWADGAAVSKEELSACSGVYDFQELVRRWLLLEEETETAPEAELEELLQKNPEICIVTNELGYGVVPIEPFDRKWREKTGRICTELAAKADSVTRVVCGIGILLKGEEKHD